MTDHLSSSECHSANQAEPVSVELVSEARQITKEPTEGNDTLSGGWLSHHTSLSWGLRWCCLLSGLTALGLLAISRSLSPSLQGHGTHQQLGLPPCTVMLLWDIPCPACGMTTSWALMTRGRIVEAATANVGGLMLAVIAIAFLPASWYFFATGRASRGYWFSSLLTVCLVTALASAIVQWLVRLLS